MLLFHGDFEFDGWDSLSNARHFEIDNGLATASRTSSDHGLWRNCFAQRALGDLGCTARYEWRLKCKRRQHREYTESGDVLGVRTWKCDEIIGDEVEILVTL